MAPSPRPVRLPFDQDQVDDLLDSGPTSPPLPPGPSEEVSGGDGSAAGATSTALPTTHEVAAADPGPEASLSAPTRRWWRRRPLRQRAPVTVAPPFINPPATSPATPLADTHRMRAAASLLAVVVVMGVALAGAVVALAIFVGLIYERAIG